MTSGTGDGDPGLQQAEASDDGASSSQFELVEEEASSEEHGEARASTQMQPEGSAEADTAPGSTTAALPSRDTASEQSQQQPAEASEQHAEQQGPSSIPNAPQGATAPNESSSAADGRVSHADALHSAAPAAEQPAAAAESSQRPASAEPVDPDFKQLEERAKQVAQGVQDMASSVSKSLQAGLFNALGSATDATSNIGHLSLGNNLGKLSSWWCNLDATMAAGSAPAPSQQGQGTRGPAGATAADVAGAEVAGGRSAESKEEAGLEAGENLVESFACKLVQMYACNHNACTPAIQMTFAGRLFITDRHVCFIIEERGKRAPVKIRLSDVSTATRERGTHRGDASDILKLVVRAPGHATDAAGASSSGAGNGDSPQALSAQGAGKGGSGASGGGLFGLLPSVLGGAASSHDTSSSSSSSAAMHGGEPGGGVAGGGYWLAFKDFEGSAGLDNALALVEHLREGT